MERFSKTTLDNGLRIITVPKPDSLATTVLVLVEAGLKYETKEINGLSHFLEHMCFKGTEKRPKAIDIASELAGLGAVSNAFTSLEYTGYFAKARSEHFDEILDVVSDVYLNSTFDSEAINRERGVIIEEINMYEDDLPRKAADVFTGLLYGDQPAGWDIAGRKEIIAALKREDFLKYRSEHYVAGATVVVVAGAFGGNEVLEKVKGKFSAISVSEKTGKKKVVESQTVPRVLIKTKTSDQTHLVLGVRAFSFFDPRRYSLEVLADILGGGMSSRLFQRVREGMGAAYYVYADADIFTDHGFLAAAAGVDNSRVKTVVEAIVEEFAKIAKEPVGEKELRRAKNHLTGNQFLRLETSDRLASYYGGQEITERAILTPAELASKIEAVTAEEVRATAADLIKNEGLNLALVGPFSDGGEFIKLLKI